MQELIQWFKKISYDPEADAMFVTVREGDYDESDEVQEGVIIDYDAQWNLLTVELLQVSKKQSLVWDLLFNTPLLQSWVSYSPSIFLKHLKRNEENTVLSC